MDSEYFWFFNKEKETIYVIQMTQRKQQQLIDWCSPHKKGTCTLISKTVWLQKPKILIEETLGGWTSLLIEGSTPSNSSYTSVLKGRWYQTIKTLSEHVSLTHLAPGCKAKD